jgi:hypothetical protein
VIVSWGANDAGRHQLWRRPKLETHFFAASSPPDRCPRHHLWLRPVGHDAFGVRRHGDQRDEDQPEKHFFWSNGATPNSNAAANDLIYHGGSLGPGAIGIEKNPAVYLVFWGPDWATGFTTPDTDGTLFTSATLQNYVQSFFNGIGGTPWAGVQTQYCRNVAAGTTSCAGNAGADYITNPTSQLKGVWTDPSAVPAGIVTLGLAENLVNDPIAAEASRADTHFGYNPDATYIILTPPGTIGTGQPVYCGYHTQTTSISGVGNAHTLQYSFIPFQNMSWPGIGSSGCGMHFVNKTSTAFGNGIFDGYSMGSGP